MWNKPLKVFKGVSNVFEIEIQDFEQQPAAISSYEFRFRVKNKEQDVVINKGLTNNTTQANRLDLSLLEEDIADLPEGMYVWGISIRDENNRVRPIYLESNGEAEGKLHLVEWFPEENP